MLYLQKTVQRTLIIGKRLRQRFQKLKLILRFSIGFTIVGAVGVE